MACPKNPIFTIFLAASLLIEAHSAAETSSTWTTLTSFSDVRQIRLIRDTVYLATSGGLLVVGNPNTSGLAFTNLDGLGTVDLTDVIADVAGQIWVGGFGRIVKFSQHDSQQFLFLDNDNKLFAVNRVVDDGDHLWVGTHLGLVLFSKSRNGGQIDDNYGLFGALTPFPDVYDIWLAGDTIWLATSVGLARANKKIPNLLKSPLNWTTFDMPHYPTLKNDHIRRVVQFESSLYVATDAGAYRMTESGTDTTFVAVPFGSDVPCADLRVEHDTLFLYSNAGLAAVKSGSVAAITLTGLPTSARAKSGVRSAPVRWVSVQGGGIWFESDGTYQQYGYAGMPTNDVAEVTTNTQGQLTAVFASTGTARYVDGVWHRTLVSAGGQISAMSDSTGDVWFGSFGTGLWHLADSGVARYTERNSTLRSVPENDQHDYIVVTGLANDGRYLYATSYRGREGQVVAIGDLDHIDDLSRWTSLRAADGITDDKVSAIDCWNGYLAIGSEEQGIFRYYVGPDPFVKSDDTVWHYTAAKGRLRSDVVRVVRFSLAGELWVGTNFGLSRFDPLRGRDGLFEDIDLPAGIGPDISDLEFDGRGNLWVAAGNGLAYRDAVSGQFTIFTTLNSGLVNDAVRKVRFDRATGKVYLATGSGVSVLSSLYGTPTDAITQAIAFPNPFVISSPNDRVQFNYSGVFNLMIFTLAGDLVRETTQQYWDGMTQSGGPAASGVYLYVLTSPSGASGRGKILLIRR